MPYIVTFIILFFILLASAIRILREYERGVIFRLGRLIGAKGPGIFFLIPFVDRMVKVSLRTVVMDVPPQDVITRDNVSVQVNAVIYFRVLNPEKSVVEVENFLFATSQLSQTTLRRPAANHRYALGSLGNKSFPGGDQTYRFTD